MDRRSAWNRSRALGAHPSERAPRLAFLDALRGLSCLAILLCHLLGSAGPLREPLEAILPRAVVWLFLFGARGVPVFFVLSGFVIAYSLRGARITPGFAGNFALRRQIRLDPVYWVCLAAALVSPEAPTGLSPGDLVANVVYLPWILRRPVLLPVSWTLCLEVQFYLVFIALLFLAQRLRLGAEGPRTSALVALVGLGSLAIRLRHVDDSAPWFTGSWYLFSLGALAYWAWSDRALFRPLAVVVGAVGTAALAQRDPDLATGAATAALIYAVARAGRLSDALGRGPLPYLGRISYSLYLVHGLVIAWTYRFAEGRPLAPGSALGWMVVAGVASVGAGHALHRLVEGPAMRFAGRFKPGAATAPRVASLLVGAGPQARPEPPPG
jgi:peptidoglycan/LPS O-acetylase OafA/YrhL